MLPPVNLVKWLFILMTFAVLILSFLVNFFEKFVPSSIVQTFRYGKFSYCGKKSLVNYFEVPKSWFKHFYIAATFYSIFLLILMSRVYIFECQPSEIILELLDRIVEDRVVTVNATTAFLASALLSLQIWRRLYETCAISVFSKCKINFVHYLIGIFHYLGAATAILIEAPGFATPSFKHRETISFFDLDTRIICGTLIFIWAWYHQYQAAIILANLRKDKNGKVITYEHLIPIGGLFDKLSSPHMFCEMVIYLSLNIILWSHTTWPYVFFWVLCNQCETALLNHWWYQSKFKVYPQDRKAFLPFIF